MMITVESAKVYRGGGRRYFTKTAAIYAEAQAIIKKKYPSERIHYGYDGRIEDPGFHWRNLPRSEVLFRRVCRLVEKGFAAHGIPVHTDKGEG